MKRNLLDSLSASLDKAIHPVSRKVDATSRIMGGIEPLPVIKTPAGGESEPSRSMEVHQETEAEAMLQEASETESKPVEKTLVNMTTVAKREPSGWSKSTVAKMTTLDNLTMVKGDLRIPNTVMDVLLPTLEPSAAVLYLRLFRLSYGYRKEECVVGLQKLGTSTNTSQKTVQRAIQSLKQRGLVERVGASFGGQQKGNHFKVKLPGSLAKMTLVNEATVDNLTTLANLTTVAKKSPNKNDDDLFKSNSHQSGKDLSFPHLAQTVAIYTAATKNQWLESDTETYFQQNIAEVPIAELKSIIQSVMARSGGRINSFNYFVKELLEWNSPERTTRRKKQLEAIAKRIRELHVGKVNYSFAEYMADVRSACVREGVEVDARWFEEIREEPDPQDNQT